jgi:hypothetical protein
MSYMVYLVVPQEPIFGKCAVRISAGTLSIMTQFPRDYSLS